MRFMENSLRVAGMYILSVFVRLKPFCTHCGREIYPYAVPHSVWKELKKNVSSHERLCCGCVCGLCRKFGLSLEWRYTHLGADDYEKTKQDKTMQLFPLQATQDGAGLSLETQGAART